MRRIIFAFLLIFLCVAGFGQKFTASVSSNNIAMGSQLKLVYEFEAEDKPETFGPPNFEKDFTIVAGPSQSSSSSVKIINGNYSKTITFSITYYLQPKKEGKFTIAPGNINFNGKMYKSNSIEVTVSKSPQKGTSLPDIFIKAIPSKTTAYVGEQIVLTYKLYTKLSVSEFGRSGQPEYPNFWAEEFDLPKSPQLKNEMVNGVKYSAAVIDKIALFPQKAGSIELEPARYDAIVQERRSNNPFNDPFFNSAFGRSVRKTLVTNPVKLNIKNITGQPSGKYLGAGKFNMSAVIDKKEVNVDDAVNLKVVFSGAGNIKLLPEPEFSFPNDFESYEPTISQNISNKGSAITGNKSFQYLLVPRNPGEFVIEPLTFSYFDVEDKKMKYLKTPLFTVKVTGEHSTTATGYQAHSPQAVEFMNKNILFIKTGHSGFRKIGSRFDTSDLFYYTVIGSVSALMMILLLKILILKRRMEYSKIKYYKALKNSFKLFKQAEKALAGGDMDRFCDLMEKGFFVFFSDKLKIPVSKLNMEYIKEQLGLLDVKEELIIKLEKEYNNISMLKYAPGGNEASESLAGHVRETLSEINKQVSMKGKV